MATKMMTWNYGVWEGEPPEGLVLVGEQWLTNPGREPSPECFGELWDGVGPKSSDDCQSCVFTGLCAILTAKQALPASQERLGPSHDLGKLVADLGISDTSIVALQNYAKGGVHPLDRPSKKEPTASKETVASLNAIADLKLSKPKKKKKRGKIVGPRVAPSAKRAAERGTKKVVNSAGTATARADYTRSKPMNSEMARLKWGIERERNPEIRYLNPGDVLTRTYLGKAYHVKVLNGKYRISGKTVATLYQAMLEATGLLLVSGRKLPTMSTRRFWNLHKIREPEQLRKRKKPPVGPVDVLGGYQKNPPPLPK